MGSKMRQLILIHPAAPPKPVAGMPCNGCGVCCLVEPCPLGAVLSARRHGACVALRWNDDGQNYRCGAVADPVDVLRKALPRFMRRLAPRLSRLLARLAWRWIAAGTGCDCRVELLALEGQAAAAEISPTMRHCSLFRRR